MTMPKWLYKCLCNCPRWLTVCAYTHQKTLAAHSSAGQENSDTFLLVTPVVAIVCTHTHTYTYMHQHTHTHSHTNRTRMQHSICMHYAIVSVNIVVSWQYNVVGVCVCVCRGRVCEWVCVWLCIQVSPKKHLLQTFRLLPRLLLLRLLLLSVNNLWAILKSSSLHSNYPGKWIKVHSFYKKNCYGLKLW